MSILSTLLETSVYAAILYLAVVLFKRIFQKKLSSLLHFALWLLVVARLCVPITFESGFHFFTAEREQTTDTGADDFSVMQNDGQTAYRAPETLKGDETASAAGSAASTPKTDTGRISPVAPAKPWLTWTNVLLALWIAGMLARFSTLLYNGLKLSRAVRENGLVPDKRLSNIYADCAKRLELRRAPKLKLLANLSSPALTVSLLPVVVVPVRLTEKFSDEQLTFALLHELTHYKRGDHLLSLLMRALEAVYWFNPVVWLTGRGLSRDMETACDGAVSALLTKNGRREYALTLLSLFSQGCRESYVLGMALSAAENDAQRRIKGVFRSPKSNRGVKAAAFLLSLTLLLSCFTTACQPTPEQEVVINKGDDALGNAVLNTPAGAGGDNKPADADVTAQLRASIGAPEHWSDTLTTEDGKVSITADADVTVPNAVKLPVANAELRSFSQSDIDHVMSVLFGDGLTWYDGTTFTKEWVQARLLEEKEELAGLDPNDSEYEFWKTKIEGAIEGYEEMYANAPYLSELTPMDTTIRDLSEGSLRYKGVNLRTEIDGETNRFTCGDWPNGHIFGISAGLGKDYLAYFGGCNLNAPWGVKMNAEEAGEQAKAIVSKLTNELELCFTAPALAFEDETNRNWGWACVFMRAVNGVQSMYTCEEVGGDMESQVQNPVQYEKIVVVLDDEGLLSFSWDSAMDITSIENEDVAILSFNEIATRAVEQVSVFRRYEIQNDPDVSITITRAELGLMRVAKQNGGYYYLPVWNFYSDLEHSAAYIAKYYKGEDGGAIDEVDENGNYLGGKTAGFPQNYGSVTINAIDGSVINKDLGY